MSTPNQATVTTQELEPARSGPLIRGQLAIWDVLHWLPADDTSLTLTGSVPVPQGVGMAEVETALRVLVERHESLRTSYHEREGEPWQTVRDRRQPSVIVRSGFTSHLSCTWTACDRPGRKLRPSMPFWISCAPANLSRLN